MTAFADILTKIYTVLFFLMIAVLTIMSALFSEYFELGRDIEVPSWQKDIPLLVVAVFLLVAALCAWLVRHDFFYFRHQVLVVSAISASFSLAFLLILQSRPYMDCISLVQCAAEFQEGDYSALNTPSHDSYLYVYPFQIGFVAFEQLLFGLFGNGNYLAVQIANVVGIFFFSGCLYTITGDLVDDDIRRKVQPLVGLFLILDLPLLIDVTFVYGDVLGWSCAGAAFLGLFHWIHYGQKRWLILVPVFLSIGYLLKTNILIFLIAAVIILVLEMLRRRQWFPLLIIALSVILTFGLSDAVRKYYAGEAGISEFPQGTPSSCWIAMGMLEDENFEDGWYNGYNLTTFRESGYDPAEADRIAKETIRERTAFFRAHPRHAVKFYLRKFVSAWNDPQFDSQIKMEWGSRHVEGLNKLAVWLIYGEGRSVLYWMMNLLHFIILAGTSIETFRAIRNKDDEARMASYLLLPVLGGMVFHLIWETQARYMIGYYTFMFPLAAAGMVHFAFYLNSTVKKAD